MKSTLNPHLLLKQIPGVRHPRSLGWFHLSTTRPGALFGL
jgi:hypothetical protein